MRIVLHKHARRSRPRRGWRAERLRSIQPPCCRGRGTRTAGGERSAVARSRLPAAVAEHPRRRRRAERRCSIQLPCCRGRAPAPQAASGAPLLDPASLLPWQSTRAAGGERSAVARSSSPAAVAEHPRRRRRAERRCSIQLPCCRGRAPAPQAASGAPLLDPAPLLPRSERPRRKRLSAWRTAREGAGRGAPAEGGAGATSGLRPWRRAGLSGWDRRTNGAATGGGRREGPRCFR